MFCKCLTQLDGADLAALCTSWQCGSLLRICERADRTRASWPSSAQQDDFERARRRGEAMKEDLLLSFAEFVDRGFEERRRGVPQWQSFLPQGLLRWASDYTAQLEAWWEQFPACQLLVLNFATLTRNTSDTMGRIAAFLSVDPGPWRGRALPHANTQEHAHKLREMDCETEHRLRRYFERITGASTRCWRSAATPCRPSTRPPSASLQTPSKLAQQWQRPLLEWTIPAPEVGIWHSHTGTAGCGVSPPPRPEACSAGPRFTAVKKGA